jgi:NADH-quinone oxidoreductase subunit L
MQLLWLIPALPLAGSLLLALAGGLLPRRMAAAIGCGTVGAAWAASLVAARDYVQLGAGEVHRQRLFQWMAVGSLRIDVGLHLDELALVMMLIVTFVGFLIHLYSVEFMERERDYSLFFCYMNLFVGAMLVLVLGDSLLSLYLGWEGVGLCSYLLIGFWYRDRGNGAAARKAFIVARIGDTALAVGIFVIWRGAGTLDIQGAMDAFAIGTGAQATAAIAAVLLLAGAVAKSAQIPLHTWLPDAMAGPAPVSALIHAATMVTAGVYLIARTQVLFGLTPGVMWLIAAIGIVTALLAALSALAQRDVKRVLAYSTMSQIGFMFLALGLGAWGAAIFHLMTHAFFKALLFLSAGMVIQATGGEHDLYRMGGLFRRLPWAGWTFAIGGASLTGLPFLTAGFYSKDAILLATACPPLGSLALWCGAVVIASLTAIYVSRAFFLAFLGPAGKPVERVPGPLMKLAVTVLSLFSLTVGIRWAPQVLGSRDILGRLAASVFATREAAPALSETALVAASSLAALFGLALGYTIFSRWRGREPHVALSPVWISARRLLREGFGFDRFYERVVVRPSARLAALIREDPTDAFYTGLAFLVTAAHRGLSATESGRVRSYATGLLLGAVLATAILVQRR